MESLEVLEVEERVSETFKFILSSSFTIGRYQHWGEPRDFGSGGEGVGDLQIYIVIFTCIGQYEHCGEPRGFGNGGEGVRDLQICILIFFYMANTSIVESLEVLEVEERVSETCKFILSSSFTIG